MRSESRTVTRDELYEQVWTTPMVHLAKEYGISDVGLAKVCRKHRIPRPGVGYWARKLHGKAPRRPCLPRVDKASLETIRFCWVVLSDEEKQESRHVRDPALVALMEREDHADPIVVPEKLRRPHKFVSVKRQDLREQRAEDRRSREPGYRPKWDWPEKSMVNVGASNSLLPRALRILDTLLKALTARDFQVDCPPSTHDHRTHVTVLGETFDIRIYEPVRRTRHVPTAEEEAEEKRWGYRTARKWDESLSGELCLQLRPEDGRSIHATFRDSEKRRLESRLNDFMHRLLWQVDQAQRLRADREREEAERWEREKRRLEEAERERQREEVRLREQARVDALLAEVRAWRHSQNIKAYVAEVLRVQALQGKVLDPDSELGQWVEWAEGVSRRLAGRAGVDGTHSSNSDLTSRGDGATHVDSPVKHSPPSSRMAID